MTMMTGNITTDFDINMISSSVAQKFGWRGLGWGVPSFLGGLHIWDISITFFNLGFFSRGLKRADRLVGVATCASKPLPLKL